MSFKDRSEAGRKRAKALAAYKDQHPVILALPRAGVPVAAEVAAALHAPVIPENLIRTDSRHDAESAHHPT